jgi:hypothetical protein
LTNALIHLINSWHLDMHFNKKNNNKYVITGATIFTLAIMTSSIMATAPAAATTTTTTSVGGEQEAVSSTATNTTNNVSNAVLGNLVMIVEFKTANINPINETYIEISTVSNVTIMPPNATDTTINATETANATLNILPNGLGLTNGQSLIMTEGDNGGAAEQENATSAFVGITRIIPDGPGGGTDVVFFSTNSTGQLAFLDNMVGIMQSEFSPGGGIIRTWEWKGGMIPFEAGGIPTTTGNQTTITSALEEEDVSSTTNNSNALLGSLFSYGENIEFDVNPINETYSVISYLGSRIIIPPNAPGIVINATEAGNVTSNIQPNGLSIEQGQGFIMTEDAAAEKEENATLTYVMLSRANPDGTGSGTGVVFFSTNSTGQLAFLDNMVAIAHVEFSPEGSIVRIWGWKGGTLPLESMLPRS